MISFSRARVVSEPLYWIFHYYFTLVRELKLHRNKSHSANPQPPPPSLSLHHHTLLDAGVYVPTLAEAIVLAVEAGTYSGGPLKGIAVGNGCTGTDIGVCGGSRTKFDAEYFAKSTALLGPELQSEIMKNCDWSKPQTISEACMQSIDRMGPLLDRINLYNVYGECISGDSDINMHKAPVSHLTAEVSCRGQYGDRKCSRARCVH